jgi:Tol biopolymer transport system component
MKTQNFLVSALFLISSFLLLETPLLAQISKAEKLYEEGIYQLEAIGNFEEAIVLFNRVVKEFPENKPVAAKALLKLGFCYERQGNQKASEVYEKIINQYSDQVSLVSQAKERLAELQKVEPAGLTMSRLIPADPYLECQTLSPDATKIAGIGWNPDQNVLVYDLSTGAVNPITYYNYGRKSCTPYILSWSPDSREVAYRVSCSGDIGDEVYPQLRIAKPEGEPHLLFASKDIDEIIPCDWLPDKSSVLANVWYKDGLHKLVLISVKDGSLSELVTLKFPVNLITSSSTVSPDGRFIAFGEGTEDGQNDIYILSLFDGARHILIDHPANDVEPRWSPDGKHIVFRSDRNGSWALWGIAINEGQAEGVPFMILEGMQDQELASWTQKGLCTRTMASTSEIYTLEIDPLTHELIRTPTSLDTKAFGMSSFPLWSPDGKYLSYRAYFEAENSPSLMIKSLIGGETSKYKLTYAAPPVGGTMRWMPDRSGLGVMYWDKDFNLYISKLNPISGEWETKQIPTGDFKGRLRQYEWSKDGKTFYYSKMDDAELNISFLSHDLESGKERILFSYERGDKEDWTWWRVSISPDGTRLAINYDLKPSILDIKTGQVHQIKYTGDKTFFTPTWSPDGKYLLVRGSHKEGDDLNELYILNVEDGSYKSLDISKYLPNNARIMISNEWSSDGKSIALDIRTWKSEVNLIQNVITEK